MACLIEKYGIPLGIEQRLQVRVHGDDECTVIEAHGEVDAIDTPRLGIILRATAQQPGVLVILDLRLTTNLPVESVETLFAAHREAELDPCSVEVQVCEGSQPERALRAAGAHRHYSVVVWSGPPCDEARREHLLGHDGMELRIPADKDQVYRVRRLSEQVMLLAGVDDLWLADYITAIGEAVANAVTHGSPPGGLAFVIFRLKPGPLVATAEIEDYGPGIANWKGRPTMPPADSLRGRGLSMMEILADRLEVTTGEKGTTVRLHKYHGLGVHPEWCV